MNVIPSEVTNAFPPYYLYPKLRMKYLNLRDS